MPGEHSHIAAKARWQAPGARRQTSLPPVVIPNLRSFVLSEPPAMEVSCCRLLLWAVDRRMSAFAQPPDFRFQFPRHCFDLNMSFRLTISPVALVVVGKDVPTGCRVAPAQLPAFPAQMQVQRLAVALENSL